MATISKILICQKCKQAYDVTYLVLDHGIQRLNEYLQDKCPHCEGKQNGEEET